MKRIRYVLVAIFAAALVALGAFALARPAHAEEAQFVPVTFIQKSWLDKDGKQLDDAEIKRLVDANLIPSEITLLVTDNTDTYKRAFKSTEVDPETEEKTETTFSLDEETALNEGWQYLDAETEIETAFDLADDVYKPALKARNNFTAQIKDSHNDVAHYYVVELERLDEGYENIEKGEITSKTYTYGELRADEKLLAQLDEDTQAVVKATKEVENEEGETVTEPVWADDAESFVTVVTVENSYKGEVPEEEIPASTPEYIATYGAPATPATVVTSTPVTATATTKNVTVNAVFANSQNQQFSVPASVVTVQLTANGADVAGKTATLSQANSWTQTFDNLPTSDSAGDISYGIRVIAQSNTPSGYAASTAQADSAGNAFTVKYAPTPSATPVSVATTAGVTTVGGTAVKSGTPNTGDNNVVLTAGMVALVGIAWVGGSMALRRKSEI